MPTVLITGASKGIGKAASIAFAKAGWNLLLISRDKESLVNLKNKLDSTKVQIFLEIADFTNSKEINIGIKNLLDRGLNPDVLINNAGVAWTGDLIGMKLEEWNWLFQVNLTSIFQTCSLVVPVMRKKGGTVINVSSHAARNAFPQWGAYCVSKAALESFTKCLSAEERSNSIRACTLTLGSVNTSIWDSETVKSSFNRDEMLHVDNVANELLHLASQPSTQLIEDITLMPSSGAF